MARKKKKHICAECGETFNHGIGLRKHQRQTGHKGSRIEEAGAPPAEKAAPPPQEAAPEPAPQAPAAEAAPQAAPTPAPEAPAVEAPPAAAAVPPPAHTDEDQTVAVSRPSAIPSAAPEAAPVQPGGTPGYAQSSKMSHTKQKLSLVGRGLKVVLSHRAKGAGQQLKKSARSSADIFREALKLAVALICFLAIPTFVFFWWKSYHQGPNRGPNRPAVFSFDDGALAARTTLLRYLDHLGKHEWDSAYSLLSPGWRRDLDRASFQDAFLDIEDVRWAVSDQRLNPSGEADVLVRLAFVEGGKRKRFLGRFRLLKSTSGWRIDRAELSPDRAS